MFSEVTKEMLDFIDASPSCYHVVENLAKELDKAGFTKLDEKEEWKLESGKSYYVTRNGSSIISFKLPVKDYKGFRFMASHSDSPSFKIKENPEMVTEKAYVRLNVEGYGGMLDAPWFDRPLSIAGRVLTVENGHIKSRLVNVDKDLLMLPSLAIHMNREANKGYSYNAQKDMQPIFGDEEAKDCFWKIIADAAGIEEKDIFGSDLFLYNRVKPTTWGANGEYISSSRLDDQECVYTTFKGFMSAKAKEYVPVHVVFDNEEVGSGTKQGAASTFLKDTLERINESLGKSRQEYHMALANSFMVSADNAHAVHPNYTDKADPVNRPVMNKGIVIKFNANQKYTTDGVSQAFFRTVCENA